MSREPIAIVGSSCRFPGNANTPAKLWQMLRAPPDLLQKIPDTRFNTNAFYHPNGKRMGCTNTYTAYLLSEPIDRFDATFFNINPREAEAIDPQQRILLEVVFEAIESAGFTLDGMRGSDTCVFVGSMTGDYAELAHRDPDSMPQYMATGTASSIISNRISYFFDWKGPSVTIDTACSSSLVAVHQAIQELRNGDSNTAVAGGSNLILSPDMFISESKLQMLSPTGRSRMWDADADGYARGEGFAAIIMKRLSDAVADGDHIECIIRETGVNQDGRTKGITMPSATSQKALIRKTYERACLDWRSSNDRCQYFEAHGTGTQAGDAIEAQGIAEAFFEDAANSNSNNSPLYVGSIKTVTGHLEGCAGLAGLLKASLALQNAAIPPNMHFNRLNPALTPYHKHLEIPTSLQRWPSVADNGCRRASVNSFGFGGTNAHVILESLEPREVTTNGASKGHSQSLLATPITLSAVSDYSLTEIVRATRNFLIENPTIDLENLAWNLQEKRSQFPQRAVFAGTSRENILDKMTSLLSQKDQSEQFSVGVRTRSKTSSPRILAIFTGQGAQWATMGRELLLHSESFSSTIKSLDDSLQQLPDPPSWSIRDELLKDDSSTRLGEAEIAQPLCTAVQVALLDLAAIANITPDAVIGHSSGEIAAAYAAGAITSHDAIRIAYYRGVHTRLARGPSGEKGAMMAVGVSFQDAEEFCSKSEFKGRINVAAGNSPSSVTIAGAEDAIAAAKKKFEEDGIFARALKVDKAYHSPHMFPCSEPYRESLRACSIAVQKPAHSCMWYSSVHRRLMNDDEDVDALRADYWVDNMVSPVLFTHALGELLRNQEPFDIALEFGPHSALKGPVLQTTKEIIGRTIPYEGMLTRGLNDMEALSTALGFIWSQVGLSASSFDAYRRTLTTSNDWVPRSLPDLPGYPWDHRQTFWHESRSSKNYRFGDNLRHDLLGRSSSENTPFNMKWRNVLRLEELPWLRGHRVQGEPIFPAAAYLVMALEASKQLVKDQKIAMFELLDVNLLASIVLEEDSRVGREIQFVIMKATGMDKQKETNILEAGFACYSCVDHSSDTWEENVSGRVRVTLDGSSWNSPERSIAEHSLVDVNVSNFYTAMGEIGLNYTGLFKGITSIQRKMGFAAATAALPEIDDHSSDMMIHPALLDSCFQTLFAAYSWPGDASIHSPFVPIRIDRICVPSTYFNLGRQERNDVQVNAYLTASSAAKLAADLDITSSSSENISIRIEGLAATSLVPAGPHNDREVFSETVWDVDISSGVSLFNESPTDAAEDLQQIEVCERLAYYYLRQLKEQISPQEIPAMKWHYQRLFEFIDYLLSLVEKGQHPTLKPEWASDKYETLLAMKEPFKDLVDVQLTTAVGENLPRIVRDQLPALEVMLENNMLDRIYKYGIGFPRGNRIVSRIAQQITHRHADMNILEVGAGTGGATSIILRTIGHSFSSYTFSDISTGFFENAQIQFKDYASKMKFKALDIEGDLAGQGFEDHSFDAVIASNVLHATKSLEHTLHNVRRLLKPGGYLMLLEVTSEILRIKLMMSGLPGWWLGGDDGRRFAPTVSKERWDSLLRVTGFSGVDTIVHDMNDASKHMTSVMVSQAVDDQVSFLRSPLTVPGYSLPGDVLVVGGTTPVTLSLVHTVSELTQWTSHSADVKVLLSLEDIASVNLAQYNTVLCMTELDGPVLKSINEQTFSALQALFGQARHVLWVTSGCRTDNPYANMSIGLGRSLPYEFPQLHLQFLDIGPDDIREHSAPRIIVENLLRLVVGVNLECVDQIVWTIEQETVVENGRLWIPRIMANDELNDRLNARRRTITRNVNPAQSPVELVWTDGRPELLPMNPLVKTADSNVRIQVRRSSPYAIKICGKNFLFLCEGEVVEVGDYARYLRPGQRVLALSTRNASTIETSADWVFPCMPSSASMVSKFQSCAMNLVVSQLDLEGKTTLLIHEPDQFTTPNVVDRIKSRGIRVVCTTTNPELAKLNGWVHLQAYSTDRELRQAVPLGVDIFWDESAEPHAAQLGARIRKALPGKVVAYSLEDFCMEHAYLDPRLPAFEISHRFAFTCRDMAGLDGLPDSRCSEIPVKDIWTLPSLSGRILSWPVTDQLAVRVHPINAKALFRSDKTYLLVGCTGGLGLSLCRWMAENGARYIVLTSRQPEKVDPRYTESIRRMEVNIDIMALDVSDRQSVHRVYHEIRQRYPPIAGVANAAMVLEDRMFSSMSLDVLTKVLRPKVDGSRYLDELFGSQQLEFFVLFSSTASVVGNRGQSNYAAANLYMVGLANNRRRRGLAASVIDIGMVLGVGYITDNGIYESLLKKHNLMPISESEFHNMFAEAVVAGRPDSGKPVQLTTGLHRASLSDDGNQPFWSRNARFSHFVKDTDTTTADSSFDAQVVPVKQLLRSALSKESHEQILEESFLSKLSRILQVPNDAIETTVSLVNLGVDSLMAVEIRTWFMKEVDVDLPVLKILGGACVSDLCKHASAELRKEMIAENLDSAPVDDQKPTMETMEPPKPVSDEEEECCNDGTSLAPSKLSILASTSPSSALSRATSPPVVSAPFRFTRTERMSFAQSRLWFLIQYVDDPTTYNVTLSYKITGALRMNDLRDAFQQVIQRHESLRTCFFADETTGEPMQAILPSVKFEIEVLNGEDVESAISKIRSYHYALDQGETLKAILIHDTPSESYLILGFNHLILDGLSAQILIQEVQRIYTSPSKLVLQPPTQYIDFAVRQRLQVENGEMGSDLAFWKSEYPDLPTSLPLLPFALVTSRKALRRYETHSVERRLDISCVERIAQFSKASKSTNFSFYLTALQVLLYKLVGITDLCIGITDANRAEKESLGVVGFLVNLLPIRLRSSSQDSLANAIKVTTQKLQKVLAHSRVPFDVLLDKLSVPRTATESPMFQVLLDYQKGPAPELVLGDSRARLHTMQDARNGIDLTFEIKETPGTEAAVTVRSQKYLYNQHGLQLLLDCYAHLLELASTNPEIKVQQLSPFSQSSVERALEISSQYQLARNEQGTTVSDRIAQVIQQYPADIALEDGLGNSLTYADLGSRVAILAAELGVQGVKPGDYVVVCCEPSFDCICSILAIHHIGATYVPLDIRNPPHRIEKIFSDCQPAIAICDTTTSDTLRSLSSYNGSILDLSTVEFISGNSISTSVSLSKSDSVAYVLYTSGSTGAPKGVKVTHANLVCQLDAMRTACSIGRETVLQQSSLGFDASIDQIFEALAFGGSLVLVPSSIRGDACEIAKLMAESKVTMAQITPSECTALLTYGFEWVQKCESFRFAFCGGEEFTPALRQQFSKLGLPSLSVYNRYGPTEVTVSSSLGKVSLDECTESISCGPALPNYVTYIVDDNQNPVPLGYSGEICVGGGGVAQGYINNETANKEKFIPNPYASAELRRLGWDRLYRTGDKGALLDDGTLVYLGRIDGSSQVKIHGRRIELGEISSVILSASVGTLTDAVVMQRTVEGDKKVLFAVVTFVSGKAPEDTRHYFKNLAGRLALPGYMRPTRWASIHSLPRNNSGKLDWNSLNSIPTPSRHPEEPQEPLSKEEAWLAKIWSEVLSDDAPLSSSSDFFELGGNSILLLRLQSLLRERLMESPRLADLFANSTLKAMTALLASEPLSEDTSLVTELDWDAEASLLAVPLVSSPFSSIKNEGLDVVLTGATGFLGSAILQRCIGDPKVAHVHCIAIRNEAAGTEISKQSDKIVPYKGDLRLPNLGLAPVAFTHLLQNADLIIHNAAEVSFLKSYPSLRAPNVTATKTLIQMAAPRRIPLHYISTGGVATLAPGKRLSETSISAYVPNATTGGYVASKWVSECVLERAVAQLAIPVYIHRPASITGPNAPVTDLMLNILHYSAKLKAFPAVGDAAATADVFDFVSVESVAEGIAGAALSRNLQGPSLWVKHHCSEKKLSLDGLKALIMKQHDEDSDYDNSKKSWKTLAIEEWSRNAVDAGMPEIVAEMVETVLTEQSKSMAFPVLVKG
ncbi:polyketide synthase [Aspergillus sclerotialis]|uniref:Polyketide synthase n=1 Tax=Aspergillus sclerotialis TaxID=2070753 RepID=A0A3A2ZL89_9EURO|nr:polyketide synthase [Aspergillus sclerotialis]